MSASFKFSTFLLFSGGKKLNSDRSGQKLCLVITQLIRLNFQELRW